MKGFFIHRLSSVALHRWIKKTFRSNFLKMLIMGDRVFANDGLPIEVIAQTVYLCRVARECRPGFCIGGLINAEGCGRSSERIHSP